MNKFMWVILCLVPLVLGGTWLEFGVATDPFCSGYSYVMCAENGSNYHPINHTIAYHDDEVETNMFCGIAKDDSVGKFGFIVASSLNDLKSSGILEEEHPNKIDRRGDGLEQYWDENCNGDELFEVYPNTSLNTARYIENNHTYSVRPNAANIDNFDILNCSSCGTILAGLVTDKVTGEILTGVNVTLYFSNPVAEFVPYLNLISNESGIYTTNVSRDIITNVSGYEREYFGVTKIPKTTYILVAKNDYYEDYISGVQLLSGLELLNVELQPYGVCQADCTYEGSNLCREECAGRNGCEFSELNGESLNETLNLIPQGTRFMFKFSTAFPESSDNSIYEGDTCSGDFLEVDDSVILINPDDAVTCLPGESGWNSERLVKYNGQVVKMLVTYCE